MPRPQEGSYPERQLEAALEAALQRIEDLSAALVFMRAEALEMRRRIRSDLPVPQEISETFWVWAVMCENVLNGGYRHDRQPS